MKSIKYSIFGVIGLGLLGLTAQPSLAQPPTGVTNLTGTWTNVNPTTGGVVKIAITNDASGFKIHTYGACSPTPCDHGAVTASPFSKTVSSSIAYGLSGQYNFGFSTMAVTAKRAYEYDGGNFLEVETRTKFAAGDTRYDYMRTELFRK